MSKLGTTFIILDPGLMSSLCKYVFFFQPEDVGRQMVAFDDVRNGIQGRKLSNRDFTGI